jgi:hypothetical protein
MPLWRTPAGDNKVHDNPSARTASCPAVFAHFRCCVAVLFLHDFGCQARSLVVHARLSLAPVVLPSRACAHVLQAPGNSWSTVRWAAPLCTLPWTQTGQGMAMTQQQQ